MAETNEPDELPGGPSNASGATRENREEPPHPAPAANPSAKLAARRPPVGPGRVRFRRAVTLARARLRATTGGRIGAVLSAVLTIAFAVIALALRVGDGADISLGGLLATATRAIAWAAGAPIALAAAHDRARADRADGIEALAASRGVSRFALESARTLAAMIQVARAIGVPVLVLSIIAVALAGSLPASARHAALAAGLLAFAAVAGFTIGGLAALCGRLAGARGRTTLAALFFLPWITADVLGYGAWSIPGALNAAIDLVVRSSGMAGASVLAGLGGAIL